MAASGVDTLINPSSFTGIKKIRSDYYFACFDRVLNFEKWRVTQYGMRFFAAIAIDPEDIDNSDAAYEALDGIPDYLNRSNVCALGEVGLENFTDLEIDIFSRQIKMASELNKPLLLHTPHKDKEEKMPKMLSILDDCINHYKNDRSSILLDDLNADVIEDALKLDLGGYGLSVSPQLNGILALHRKLSPEEVLEIINTYGAHRFIVGTELAFGHGEPMALARTRLYLRLKGVSEEDLDRLFTNNALQLFRI
ncbi:MAG: TatD family hydrolase [Thermoleophilia bacterium]